MTPQTVLLVLLLFFMSILAQHKKNHNSFEIKEGEHVNSGPCQRNTVKTSEFPLIDLILLSNLSNTDPTYWFCDPWIPWPAQIDFPRLAIYNFSTTLVSPEILNSAFECISTTIMRDRVLEDNEISQRPAMIISFDPILTDKFIDYVSKNNRDLNYNLKHVMLISSKNHPNLKIPNKDLYSHFLPEDLCSQRNDIFKYMKLRFNQMLSSPSTVLLNSVVQSPYLYMLSTGDKVVKNLPPKFHFALISKEGAGKSTLLQQISRFAGRDNWDIFESAGNTLGFTQRLTMGVLSNSTLVFDTKGMSKLDPLYTYEVGLLSKGSIGLDCTMTYTGNKPNSFWAWLKGSNICIATEPNKELEIHSFGLLISCKFMHDYKKRKELVDEARNFIVKMRSLGFPFVIILTKVPEKTTKREIKNFNDDIGGGTNTVEIIHEEVEETLYLPVDSLIRIFKKLQSTAYLQMKNRFLNEG